MLSIHRVSLTVSAGTGVVLAAAMGSAYGWTHPSTATALAELALTATKAARLGVASVVAALAPRRFARRVLGPHSGVPRRGDGGEPEPTPAESHA